jgi:hypothetical protein
VSGTPGRHGRRRRSLPRAGQKSTRRPGAAATLPSPRGSRSARDEHEERDVAAPGRPRDPAGRLVHPRDLRARALGVHGAHPDLVAARLAVRQVGDARAVVHHRAELPSSSARGRDPSASIRCSDERRRLLTAYGVGVAEQPV